MLSGPSRRGERGEVFPGPSMFGGPTTAQNCGKRCFRWLLFGHQISMKSIFQPGLCPRPQWGSLRCSQAPSRMMRGHPPHVSFLSTLLASRSRSILNEVVIGPRENGFPRPPLWLSMGLGAYDGYIKAQLLSCVFVVFPAD